MNNFVSKLVGLGGHARALREGSGNGEVSSDASPRSQSSASLQSSPRESPAFEAGPVGDAFTRPTIRPVSTPASALGFASSMAISAAPSADDEGHPAGFGCVIRHLSLLGWLRWIHFNRSDATLRVRAGEGGTGSIWCSGGRLIDAEWEGREAEEALREMLLLSSGSMTIDFDRVEHLRRIVRPTHELLQVIEGGADHPEQAVHREAGLGASTSARGEPFRPSGFLPVGSISMPTNSTSSRPNAKRRRFSRGDYAAAALLLAALAVAAFAFGRLRASSDLARSNTREHVPAEQSRVGLLPPPAPAKAELPIITPKPRELPLLPFVAIEVEPAYAQIWLDRELAGVGRVQLGAIQDGMMHELKFAAPEHATKTLFFRDTPPAGRVILERVSEHANVGANAPVAARSDAVADPDEAPGQAAVSSAQNPGGRLEAEHDAPKKSARRRPVVPTPPPPRARPAAEDAASAASSPSAVSQTNAALKKSPQVRLIEVHTPRVQVLD
jgi:hypothetical protein